MNSEFPHTPREELEASITAMLLGELPSDKAFALGRAIEQDPELAQLYNRFKKTIELVHTAEKPDTNVTTADATPPKLNEQRRQELLQRFKTVAPKEFAETPPRRTRWLLEIAVAACIVFLMASLLLPALSKAKSKSMAARTAVLRATAAAEFDGESPAVSPHPANRAVTMSVPPENSKFSRLDPKPEDALAAHFALTPMPGPPNQNRIVLPSETLASKAGQNGAVADGLNLAYQDAPAKSDFFDSQSAVTVGGTVTESRKPESQGGWTDTQRQKQGNVGLAGINSEKSQVVLPPVVSAGSDFGIQPGANLPADKPAFGDPQWVGSLEKPRLVAKDGGDLVQQIDRRGGGTGGGGGGTVLATAPATPVTPEVVAAPLPSVTFSIPSSGQAVVRGEPSAPEAELFRRRYGLPGQGTVTLQGQIKTEGAGLQNQTTDKNYGYVTALGAAQPPIIDPATSMPAAGQPLAVDPATGLPVPMETPVAAPGAVDPATGLPMATEPAQSRSGPPVFSSNRAPASTPPLQFIPQGRDQQADLFLSDGKPPQRAKESGTLNDRLRPRTLSEAKAGTGSEFRGTKMPVVPLASSNKQEGTSYPNASYYGGANPVAATPPQSPPVATTLVTNAAALDWKFTTGTASPNVGSIAAPTDQIAHSSDGTLVAQSELKRREGAESSDRFTQYRQLAQLNSDGDKSVAGGRSTIALPQSQEVDSLGLADVNRNGRADAGPEASKSVAVNGSVRPAEAKKSVEELALNKAYNEKKGELEELLAGQRILNMKTAAEGIDTHLPTTGTVSIIEKATTSKKTGLWERLKRSVGGNVERHAVVKAERDQSDISGLSEHGERGQAYDPYFVQSEFEVIQSDAVLARALEKLKVNTDKDTHNLSRDESVETLKKKLDLRPVKGTTLVSIGVKSSDSDEAARIANAVADAYREHSLETRIALSTGGIEAIPEHIVKQFQPKAQELQSELDKLGRKLAEVQKDAPMPRTNSGSPIPQPEIASSDNPFSTFSLNVSDVSFKLAQASLEKGVMPDPAGIRSEEFINAFDYRDPEPAPGAPFAFAFDRTQYPFAQNRDLLRFSLKTASQGRQPGRPLNLVLLLDNSGSMERADRQQIIHEALRVLAAQLQPQDKFSVVTFARTAQLRVDGVAGDQAAQTTEQLSGLTPEGGTNLEDAMNLAYQTARKYYSESGINRVVLLTDGAANLGDVNPESLKQKVEAQRKQGIALDCFGIGWEGFNDDLLEVLSRNGDGRYGFVNTPEQAATEFAGQLAGALQIAASDVKVQVEFNPARISAYRQIGYAKHQLTKEQFRDNTVDAAEIGAAESGNALYVAEVKPNGTGPLATVRVRYKVPGTQEYKEHEWAVPYNGNAGPLDQATPAMRLAATASAFSEWLAGSPFAGDVRPNLLLPYLNGVADVYGADARPKKLEWMIRTAQSLGGK
jgi:Mg-chelatase subunit ChlD